MYALPPTAAAVGLRAVTAVIPTGRGLSGAAGSDLVAGVLGVFTAAIAVEPIRSAVRKFVFPDPGEGPTRERIEGGYFTVRVLGRGTATEGPFTVNAIIGADRDPGYGATARILGESAMWLVRDETDSPLTGGILTPASGTGEPLADRLRAVGCTATVDEASVGTGD